MFRPANKLVSISWLLSIFALTLTLASATGSQAQKRRAGADEEQQPDPMFVAFKGVRIGTPAEEARKKLGNPHDKSEEQDLFLPNDAQAIQVFYDKKGTVTAISIDFMGGGADAPSAKEVLGTNADTKPDGSMYKMIRYTKAGYWVSYSRTAGDSPTVTITMQRIEP